VRHLRIDRRGITNDKPIDQNKKKTDFEVNAVEYALSGLSALHYLIKKGFQSFFERFSVCDCSEMLWKIVPNSRSGHITKSSLAKFQSCSRKDKVVVPRWHVSDGRQHRAKAIRGLTNERQLNEQS
jgi:hypothetical protein